MPYEQFPVEGFGGLVTVADPQEVGAGAATSLLNVDFDRRGRLRSRGGYVQLNSTTLASDGYQAIIAAPFNNGEIIGIRREGVADLALDSLFAGNDPIASETASFTATATAGITDYAFIGTPSGSAAYFAIQDGTTAGLTVRKYNGTAVSTVSTGKPQYVCATPISHRLAHACFWAAADSPSGADGAQWTVFFSDAGAPDTFTASNFVHLSPGDGEQITGMAAWDRYLFVCKQSAVFVFTGESTDPTGAPIFHFERITLPYPVPAVRGSQGVMRRTIVAGSDGVYISTTGGIVRISSPGSPAVVVTEPVEGVFAWPDSSVDSAIRIGNSLWGGGTTEAANLSWASGRLIATYTNGDGDPRCLVRCPWTGDWTLWQIGTDSNDPPLLFTQFPADLPAFQGYIAFALGNDVFYQGPTIANDDGVAVPWSYTSGQYDLGAPAVEKVTRQLWVRGTGSVTVAVLTNDNTSDASAAAVTLGTSPAVDENVHRVAYRGVWFRHRLSGAGATVIHSLVHDIRSVRLPGMRSS